MSDDGATCWRFSQVTVTDAVITCATHFFCIKDSSACEWRLEFEYSIPSVYVRGAA